MDVLFSISNALTISPVPGLSQITPISVTVSITSETFDLRRTKSAHLGEHLIRARSAEARLKKRINFRLLSRFS